ncbi:MAG: hypothetical protein Fues2KO_39020 [Fuerstiella sp.]
MSDSLIRTSRTRRAVAFIGWGVLVLTAVLLSFARIDDVLQHRGSPVAGLVLSLFAAFVGVFSWLLFNPGRRSAADSPALAAGAIATLFPPPIICYCLLGTSALAPWLSLGVFLVCVIAILSEVPDDFFGVPRDRSSYFVPMPVFDRVEGDVMDPNASWFRFNDLSKAVADVERPSLAPRSYRDQDRIVPAVKLPAARPRSYTSVDDLLPDDNSLGLLNEPLWTGDDDDDIVDSHLAADQAGTRPDQIRSGQRSGSEAKRVGSQIISKSSDSTKSRQQNSGADERIQPEKKIARPQAEVRSTKTPRQATTEQSNPRGSTLVKGSTDSGTNAPRSTRWTESRPVPAQREDSAIDRSTPREESVEQNSQSSFSGAAIESDHAAKRPRDETSATALVAGTAAAAVIADEVTSRDESSLNAERRSGAEEDRKLEREAISDSTRKTIDHDEIANDDEPAIQRSTDESGLEYVEGVLKVRFDKGQKRANLHVPFSPPLADTPDVECECVGGDDVRLKVPVRQPYGIRIEARRSHADEPIETEVGFAAVSRSAESTSQ